jgi:hypothetical protein
MLTSKISSSRRIISWFTPALRVIVSNAGAVAARDASLASVSDNPVAPKAGIVLLRRFLFDARFGAYLPSGCSPAFALLLGPRMCNLIFGWSGASGCLGRGMVCPLSQSAARQIVPDELPDRSNSGAGDKIAAF